MPLTPPSSPRRKSGTGTPRLTGSAESWPAIAPRRTAQSSTVLVIGPTLSNVELMGTTPRRLTRPVVGLRPTTPSTDAGQRIEPPPSVPMAPNAERTDTATPDPALEPPG